MIRAVDVLRVRLCALLGHKAFEAVSVATGTMQDEEGDRIPVVVLTEGCRYCGWCQIVVAPYQTEEA